jgi:hypothetical protein
VICEKSLSIALGLYRLYKTASVLMESTYDY